MQSSHLHDHTTPHSRFSFCHLNKCVDKFSRYLRHDRVSVGAQSSHSTGNPMSQREKAGLSWPGFSVDTGEPFTIGPRITDCASLFKSAHPCFVPCFCFCPLPLGVVSCACGVHHAAIVANFLLVFPSGSGPPSGSALRGAGHAERFATSFNGREFFPCWLLRPSRQSLALAVGHEP